MTKAKTTTKTKRSKQDTAATEIARLARDQRADAATILRPETSPRTQRGRHDRGAPPRNHRFLAGHLIPNKPKRFGPSNDRSVALAASLLRLLGGLFEIDGGERGPRPLSAVIGLLLREAKPRGDRWETEEPKLEDAFELLTGRRFGDSEWWESLLQAQIEMAARNAYEIQHRAVEIDRCVQARRRGEPSKPLTEEPEVALLGTLGEGEKAPEGAFNRYATSKDVLIFLLWVADGAGGDLKQALPRELTDARIQRMIDQCAIGENGAGGGKKSAVALVTEFKAELRR